MMLDTPLSPRDPYTALFRSTPLRRSYPRRQRAPAAGLPRAPGRGGCSPRSPARHDSAARSGCRRRTPPVPTAGCRASSRGGSTAPAAASCRFPGQPQEHANEIRRPMPLTGLVRQLPSTRGRDDIVLGALVVVGRSPLAANGTLELELAEQRVERTVIQADPVPAD